MVVNLESSIAVTQNFVSPTNLPGVLYFLKHRADQVSGFKLRHACAARVQVLDRNQEYRGEDEDETGGGAIFARFVDALGKRFPEICMEGLKGLAKLEMQLAESAKDNRMKRTAASRTSLWRTFTSKSPEEQEDLAGNGGFTLGFEGTLDSIS